MTGCADARRGALAHVSTSHSSPALFSGCPRQGGLLHLSLVGGGRAGSDDRPGFWTDGRCGGQRRLRVRARSTRTAAPRARASPATAGDSERCSSPASLSRQPPEGGDLRRAARLPLGAARGLRVVAGDLHPAALAPRADDLRRAAAEVGDHPAGAATGRAGRTIARRLFVGGRHAAAHGSSAPWRLDACGGEGHDARSMPTAPTR